ncbi:hypothetical protein [Prochlorococcus marinus]|uniref:Uncharacterized protein n=1 Tax=Prochlorococcus marinus str. PAC1 TaxID=59924 RepID=A0A0A2CBX4_PROMR|nr:hypothetical protein [Prochlorococcus marinus]KGG22420.1 hypothetical protein EV03_0090 [Prochlorococcus marinus str. PAC1]
MKIKTFFHPIKLKAKRLIDRFFLKDLNHKLEAIESKIDNLNKNNKSFLDFKNITLDHNNFSIKFKNRDDFLSLLENTNSILEIGPFDKPSIEKFRRGNKIIHYADWLSQDELIERAREIEGRNIHGIPEIKYILSNGFDQIKSNYDAVVSHHCIEHVPCLITHLNQIHEVITNKGVYLMSVPNKNDCFDHFIPESSVLDIITAFYEKRSKPNLRSVLEHRCFTSHNWQTDENPFMTLDPNRKNLFKSACNEYFTTDYVDVHCWQFSPESFNLIINQLTKFNLINPIESLEIFPNTGEFYVSLKYK